MKRKIFSNISVFIIAVFTLLIPFQTFANLSHDANPSGEVYEISNLPDIVPVVPPVQLNISNDTTIIDVSTGLVYESEKKFFDCVGNVALEQDPDLLYYIGYHVGYPMYIYSNRTPYETLISYVNGEKL